MKYILICLWFLLPALSQSQNYTGAYTCKMNGYVVNLGGFQIFQQADDTTSVWDALDNTGFMLLQFRDDQYLEAIEGIGDSAVIDLKHVEDNKTYRQPISWFYCSLEINMFFLDSSTFRIFKQPKFELYYNDKKYPFWGVNVDNRILKIIPRDDKDLLKMYHYYTDKGYTVHEWLEQLIASKKKRPAQR